MDEVERKIGGTRISQIYGLSRWGGPMDAYLGLTGIVEDNVESEAAYWGKEAQPAILRRYNKETGRNMQLCDITYQHPKYEFITFTPDSLEDVLDTGIEWPRSNHVLEMKETTIRDMYGEPGTDQVSDETGLQGQLYMGCCGAQTCDVAVHFLKPRHEFAIYHLKFNQEIFDNIIQTASDFWFNHIIPQIPPPLDASDASRRLLNHLYPKETEDLFAADENAEEIAKWVKFYEKERDEAVRKLTLFQNDLKNKIGDHAGVVTSLGKVTWKKNKDSQEVDWKAAFDLLSKDFLIMGTQLDMPFLNEKERKIAIERAIRNNTTIRPGTRVFRAWWKDKED